MYNKNMRLCTDSMKNLFFQNEQGCGVKIRIIKHVGTYSCICPFVTC